MLPEFKRSLIDEICKRSPIRISDFMRIVNTHPAAGYYTTKANILGHKGDFITSPEITQMFGECIGIFIGNAYSNRDFPHVHLFEFGPGTGTLACDVLRTLRQLRRFSSTHFSYSSIDTNPYFIEAQRKKISNHVDKFETFGSFSEVSSAEESNENSLTIFLAHEYLDALPTDLYYKQNSDYYEVKIVRGSCDFYLEKFAIEDGNKMDEYIRLNANNESTMEFSSDVKKHIQWIKSEITKNRGHCLGLIIDYGYYKPSPYSLRAILQHQFVGIFDNVGEADYSVNVDFKLIREILESDKSISCELFSQSRFLIDNGIYERMQALCSANPTVSGNLKRDVHRLISPAEMGQIYKFLSFKK